MDTLAADRTATYSTLPLSGAEVGFPITTWTGTVASLPAGSPSAIPIVFGLAGRSSGLTVQALASFPVTISVVADGVTRTATTSISVPVGAGLF